MQDEAAVLFKTAGVLARMVSGKKGEKLQLMKEYPFLWTDDERKQSKLSSIMNYFQDANKRIRARKKALEKLKGETQ